VIRKISRVPVVTVGVEKKVHQNRRKGIIILGLRSVVYRSYDYFYYFIFPFFVGGGLHHVKTEFVSKKMFQPQLCNYVEKKCKEIQTQWK